MIKNFPYLLKTFRIFKKVDAESFEPHCASCGYCLIYNCDVHISMYALHAFQILLNKNLELMSNLQ